MLSVKAPTAIPQLQDYDISPLTGFLPPEGPLRRLPGTYFEPWEDIMDQISALLLCGRFRARVNKLEILDVDRLVNLREQQRAFVVLCFLSHAYVWGKNEPISQSLPPCLAVPFVKVSEQLGINPIGCNASQVVWNWRLMDPSEPISLDNIGALHTFTGSTDEAWFYLVTVGIEAHGGRALAAMVNSMTAVREGDEARVACCLQDIDSSIQDINRTLKTMYDKCDPYLFYWKIRPYLAGWENMSEAGLPHGVLYQGVDARDQFRQYAGGSAGQSSLIQAFDIALGIAHYPTSDQWRCIKDEEKRRAAQGLPKTKPSHTTYLYGMRSHMPGLHRRFLEDLTKAANLRPYVDSVQGDCARWYNRCVAGLKKFRDLHIQIVTRYIILPARKGPSIGSFSFGTSHPDALSDSEAPSTEKANVPSRLQVKVKASDVPEDPLKSPRLHASSPTSKSGDILYPQLMHADRIGHPIASQPPLGEHGISKTLLDPSSEIIRGTGGTDLMPFLKQVRDETTDSLIRP
ncbi:tryptophan 2,3- dioxygenase [Entomophthora muscae]|uniref:Tryptophan 2,3- dioxygenase n=1 Tax=Entomophthora muscae TaxID=34485 RepID=A0ACC2UU40_9FUNG|nr:tryptophan 2,3- dioxygenase [Entomophthora muscae]